VEFYLQTLTLDGTDGWTFQLDAGGGFVTRLSELNGSSHGWQLYHYDLASGELVSNLRMRFQFRGGSADERIDLDQISVVIVSGGTSSNDRRDVRRRRPRRRCGWRWRVRGADSAMPAAAVVRYYVVATDGTGQVATNPTGAPDETYSYIVGGRTVGLFFNTAGAFAGYTLFAPKHYTRTYLVNNDGRLVHTWDSAYEPGQSVYLLENGHLLHACFTQGALTGGGEGGRVEEYDWDGNLVWEFNYSSDQYMSHHDIRPLPNGNVLLLVVEKKSYAEVIAAGFDPGLLDLEVQQTGYMLPDSVVEVQPVGSSGGNVVWSWHVWIT